MQVQYKALKLYLYFKCLLTVYCHARNSLAESCHNASATSEPQKFKTVIFFRLSPFLCGNVLGLIPLLFHVFLLSGKLNNSQLLTSHVGNLGFFAQG